jgi:hypothetical protein
MRALRCQSVRRDLEAFHDGELSVQEQVAVAAHVQNCASCAHRLQTLAAIGTQLREEAQHVASDPPDLGALRDAILSRAQAEHNESLPVRVSHLFDDMHLVWAGLSATGAMVTCAAILFAIWFLSPPERDDSLAGVLSALASPGSDRNPVMLDLRMRLPRVNDDAMLPAMLAATATEKDLVLTLAAVVTQEGRISRSEVLESNHQDRDAVLLMNAISGARFQPASLRGSPVAVNLVWMLTHTTVRGKIHG